jgi:hypothetical protein
MENVVTIVRPLIDRMNRIDKMFALHVSKHNNPDNPVKINSLCPPGPLHR